MPGSNAPFFLSTTTTSLIFFLTEQDLFDFIELKVRIKDYGTRHKYSICITIIVYGLISIMYILQKIRYK